MVRSCSLKPPIKPYVAWPSGLVSKLHSLEITRLINQAQGRTAWRVCSPGWSLSCCK